MVDGGRGMGDRDGVVRDRDREMEGRGRVVFEPGWGARWECVWGLGFARRMGRGCGF